MGSPIWGPVKLAMMAANDRLETIEKLTQLLHRIVTSLERYSNYENLFHNHITVRNAVGLLYSDVLDLCSRVEVPGISVVVYLEDRGCSRIWQVHSRPFIIGQLHEVLRTLASQLLARHDSLYPLFAKLHEESGQKEAKSLVNLKLSTCSGISTLLSPIWIVANAADECNDAVELIQSLVDLTKLPGTTPVKLVLVCRDEPALLEALQRCTTVDIGDLLISPNDSRALIWRYVKDRVGLCKNIAGTELGSQVPEGVAAAADGLWMYARLIMDEIQRLPSRAAIERQL
ncbi:uncharacterized protein PAC_05821 [Phialocephala subalpina]|uniref:Nephrocystin 3-like N-terminal domain-containing protein n=1 Tax=Phialocephala subalpina TaxID=576137 RepID=A0A1L7WT67_9HELO|nr:uncharacterized protein PAC_05821 [Phialocephala subalpina]